MCDYWYCTTPQFKTFRLIPVQEKANFSFIIQSQKVGERSIEFSYRWKISRHDLYNYKTDFLILWGIGQGFDRSLWPGGRTFELSCCPGGRDIWIFANIWPQIIFRGGEFRLYLTLHFCPEVGNLTAIFWKMSYPRPIPCLPAGLTLIGALL